MSQQAIAKTVEVSTADTFIVNSTGVDQTVNPSISLYPNIFALAADIDDQSWGLAFSVGWIGSAGGVAPRTTSPNRFIIRSGTELVDITGTIATKLGFVGSEAPIYVIPLGEWVIEATYPPEEIWFPTYHSSDQNWFIENPDELFRGSAGTDGNLSGIVYSAQKKRVAEWPFEFATNAIPKANSATAIEEARSFSYLINAARQMVLQRSGSGNKYCKGVYYIEDTDQYDLSHSGMPAIWENGGIDENYVFCSAGKPVIGGASSNNTRRYYDISLELTTAAAPNWGWDIR